MDHVLHNYMAGAVEGALAGAAQALSDAAVAAPRKTRLLLDYVVLRFPRLPEVSAGGIVLDGKRYYGNADGSVPRDAEVVAVGPGKWVEYRARRPGGGYTWKEAWHPTTVRVGDRVLVDAMYTQEGLMSEWDGEPGDFRRVREWQIAAVLEAGAVLEVA